MLQTLREKTSGWFATVVLAALTVPFAFFGIDQYLTQHNETFVAKLEAPPAWWPSAPATWPVTMLWQRDTVETDEFRTAFERARQQARQQQGEQFDPRAFESADNKRKVLDQLIDQHVMQMTAQRHDIAISDVQVRSTILGIPAFQGDSGRFDPQRYQLALAGANPPLTPRGFEQKVREGMASELIPQQVAQSAFVTPSEVQRLLRILGEKRDVSFVVLPAPAPDTAPVGAQDIQRWYDSHPADYRAPETATIEYVDIDGSTLPAPAAADDATLRQRYEQEKARFVQPEQRLAAHILVKVPEGASAAVQKAAEQKAQQIAAQARQPGADFAALARADSEDAGSKAGGGDLGWVTKGQMVKPFEDALFAMQPNEVRGPIKTQFGWHVIQLREVKAGAQTPFEQVRDQLAKEQAEADREHAFNDLVGKLVDQVYKNPTSLGPAARSAGLAVQKLGPFARGQGSGIAANPAVQRAAFSESAIEDGTVSDPVEVGPNHSVLIRVVAHEQARQRPLAEVAPQVVAAVRADRARRASVAVADAMVAALRQGKPLAELAGARGLPAPSDAAGLPRGAPVPDPKANDAIFATVAPAAGRPAPGKAVLDDGRVVVFVVRKVTPGNPGEATPEQQQAMRQQVAQFSGEAEAAALVESLRRQLKITVAEDRL
ncbi:MAG TPA: SurA N-terminal domain-containing protein [Xanthomonadaceae bacterium]|nr:SurA N-terminal domain-containing protein [Xanthomonadaceae bacterium]